jgi:hypothetical protein
MPNNLVFNGVAENLQMMMNGIDGTSVPRRILTDSSGQMLITGSVTVTAENLDIRDLNGATDSISVFNTVTVTAENLDIRNLAGATDFVSVFNTVTVTAENLDIRDLAGATDFVSVFNTVTVTAENLDIRNLAGATDFVSVFNTVTVTAENLDIRDLAGATDFVSVFNTVTVTAENLDIRNLSGITDSIQLSSRLFTETNSAFAGVTNSAGVLVQNTGEKSLYSFYIFNTGANTVTVQLQISPTTVESYYVNDFSGTVGVPTGGKSVLIADQFLQFTRLFYETSGAACSFDVYYNAQV